MKTILKSLVILTILSWLIAAGCFQETNERKVLIYTSVPSAIMSEIEAAFEREYADIDVSVYRNGTEAIVSKINAEREAGTTHADIIWVADPSYPHRLKEEGLLHAFESKHKNVLSSYLYDADGCYYAGRIITTGIAYNTNLVPPEEVPQTWNDLWDEKWRKNLILANPLYSGMAVLTVGTLAEKYSWDYFTELRNNGAAVVQSNNTVAKKVAMGEFPIGVTIDYIVTMMHDSGSPIDLKYPEDGVVTIPSPLAILKNSPNIKDAELFVEYILSKKGQELLVSSGAFTSVRLDVDPRPGTPTRDEILARSIPIDWSREDEMIEQVKRRFSAIMLFWEEE